METGDRIKLLRDSKNLTTEQLSKIAGVSRSSISQWENHLTSPSATATLLMAKFFKVSPYYLIFGEDAENQVNSRFDRLITFCEKITQLEKNNKLTQGNLDHIDIILNGAIDSLEQKLDGWIKEHEAAKKTA